MQGGNTNFAIFASRRYCVKLLSTEEYGHELNASGGVIAYVLSSTHAIEFFKRTCAICLISYLECVT